MHDVRTPPAANTAILSNAQTWCSAALVLAVGAGTLLSEAAGLSGLESMARVCLLLWLAINLHRTRGIEIAFIGAALAFTSLVFAWVAEPARVLLTGLDRAGMFLTFVATLNFLRDAAQSSAAVRRSGRYLIAQSPPRRYVAITLGGHLFTIALNMGTLTLLGALIRRSNTLAAAGGDPVVVAIRERRMTLALIRGFGTTLLWTPMGVSVAYTLSLVPALTWFDVAPAMLALSFTWLAVGWIVDRLEWPPSTRRRGLPPPEPVSPRELLPMLGITALLLLGVIVAKMLVHSSLLVAVMSTVPFMAIVWIFLQYRRFGVAKAAAATTRRLGRHLRELLPQTRTESIVLAAAAYLGFAIGALINAGGFSASIATFDISAPMVAIAAFLVIFFCAQIGVTPLITSTIVGTTITQINPDPIPPLALAIAIQAGWALSSCCSPFTGGTLTLARMIGKSGFIFQRWNATYAAACGGLLILTFIVWLA